MKKYKKVNYVWAIEMGEYSSYHIIGVYSSYKNAKLVYDKIGGNIVRWQLDLNINELPKNYTVKDKKVCSLKMKNMLLKYLPNIKCT